MAFLRGNVYFLIIAIGEYANHDRETISASLHDRAIYSAFITLGLYGLDCSWIRQQL